VAALSDSPTKETATELLKSVRHLIKGCQEDIQIASGVGLSTQSAEELLSALRKDIQEDPDGVDPFTKELAQELTPKDVQQLRETLMATGNIGSQVGFLNSGKVEAELAIRIMDEIDKLLG